MESVTAVREREEVVSRSSNCLWVVDVVGFFVGAFVVVEVVFGGTQTKKLAKNQTIAKNEREQSILKNLFGHKSQQLFSSIPKSKRCLTHQLSKK